MLLARQVMVRHLYVSVCVGYHVVSRRRWSVRGVVQFLCVGHSVDLVDEVGVISSGGHGEASFSFCVLVTV